MLHAVSDSNVLSLVYDSVLTADAANFDVQNIPQGYKHLRILATLRTTEAVVISSAITRLNNDSGANYDRQSVSGADTTASAASTLATAQWTVSCPGASAQAGAVGPLDILLQNYTGTTLHKVATGLVGLSEDTAGDNRVTAAAFRWRSTSAVNRVTITAGSGNLVAGSRLTIYGLN